MQLTVRISKDDLSKMGANSIRGKMAGKDDFEEFIEADNRKLLILFEVTSDNWRRKNGGPEEIIIPEIVIPCLMEDLVSLKEDLVDEIEISRYHHK